MNRLAAAVLMAAVLVFGQIAAAWADHTAAGFGMHGSGHAATGHVHLHGAADHGQHHRGAPAGDHDLADHCVHSLCAPSFTMAHRAPADTVGFPRVRSSWILSADRNLRAVALKKDPPVPRRRNV